MTNTTQSKSELKPTNIPWLGNIPADWEVRRLKSVMNLNPSKSKILDYDQQVVFLPMENVTSEGVVDNSTTKPVKDLISGFTYFEKNDVIVAKITPCFENGKGALLDKLETNFGFGSTEFHVLRANLKELLPKYLYLITKSISFREIGEAFMQGSAGQKRITTDFVQNFQIPLPPIPTQKAIVEYLDTKTNLISQFISDKQTMITRLKEQKQSLIHSVVTKGIQKSGELKPTNIPWLGDIPADWEVRRLKTIGRAIIGLTYDPKEIVDDESGTLVLRSSNVQNSKISLHDNVYVSKEIPNNLTVKNNDILICSRNGSIGLIGKCALIDEKTEGMTFGAFMTIFRSQYNQYLIYYFKSTLFRQQMNVCFTTTINQLTSGILNEFIIPLPPLLIQKAIVEYLDIETAKVDTLIDTITQEIELTREYKQSLIYKAVTGKILVE